MSQIFLRTKGYPPFYSLSAYKCEHGNSVTSHPDTQVVGSTYEPFESSYMRMVIEADGISWQDNVLTTVVFEISYTTVLLLLDCRKTTPQDARHSWSPPDNPGSTVFVIPILSSMSHR
jgi:hypothetical protein